MLRSLSGRLVFGALAAGSFAAGIAMEPLFEAPALATVPARTKAAQHAPVQPVAVALPAPAVVKVEAPAPVEAAAALSQDIDNTKQSEKLPSVVEGKDADKDMEFVEMKDMPEAQGQSEPGQDVNMIDEPVGGIEIPSPASTSEPATPDTTTAN
jgi:hypothetical protein